MDHPCHKCGQAVEDGTAFCSRCGAPQIRVALAQPISDATSSAGVIFTPDVAGQGVPKPLVDSSFSIQWHHGLPSCALAALAGALLMCLGLMVPLLAVLGTGFFAVALYRWRTLGAPVKGATGAQLGAVSGLFAFGMAAILETIVVAVLHSGGQVRQKMLDVIQQAASRTNDPQTLAVFDYFKTPAGMAVMMVFLLAMAFFLCVVLGGLGGALGGVLFGRRDRS